MRKKYLQTYFSDSSNMLAIKDTKNSTRKWTELKIGKKPWTDALTKENRQMANKSTKYKGIGH